MSVIDDSGQQELDASVDLVRRSPRGEPLSPFLVLFYYAKGVFPFMARDDSSLWWSPEPRAVLFLNELRINRSFRKFLKKNSYRVTADTCFREVVRQCRITREQKRLCKTTGEIEDGPGSWITDEIIDVFTSLHMLGHAHSIEVWDGDHLVGGLYGVAVGQMFFGCSMFHTKPNASKVALLALVQQLEKWGFRVVDCQMYNPYLKKMGARPIPRDLFHKVSGALVRGTRFLGSWTKHFT